MKTPKEIKEFLNNKVLANISGNIPKIETISIDNFLEWFESGVLIPNEFYYLKKDNCSWVIQFKEFIVDDNDSISFYYMLKIHDNGLISDDNCLNNGWVKATPAQKQQLIDKVQEETGKVWNEDTKMFEEKPKDILVPECIKIVKGCDGKLGLLFNERKQVITSFNVSNTIFDLNLFDYKFHKIIPCKLVPVHDDDIKIGEIFFCCEIEYVNTNESVNNTDLANITDQRHYVIKVTDENGVSIQDEGCSIRIHGIDTGAVVYKVIPIK